MNSDRTTARIAGALLIVATAASLLGTAIDHPVLTGTDYLTRISDHMNRVSAGALLEFVAAGTSAGIAISLYPILKRQEGSLALGAVIFRAIEAVMYAAAAVSMLSLLKVAQKLTNAAATDRGTFQAIGDSLLAAREQAVLAGVVAFAVGALMYYYAFYRLRLVPRWLSGWGIAAELLMLGACLSALFSRNPVTSYTPLVLPIAVQEMVLAVWLIVKGFDSAAVEPRAVVGVGAATVATT